MTAPQQPVVSNWNLPNALTTLRIVLVPVYAWFLLGHDHDSILWRCLAYAVFAVAMITDKIDGDIARSRGLVTDFGKIADPIADKALIGAALIGLSLLDELPWWVTVLVLVREVGITVLRLVVIRHGVMPASHGGKLKTILQATALVMYLLPLTGLLASLRAWVMVLAVVVTVVTGVDYVVRALHLRRTSERAEMKRERRRTRGPR